MDCSVNKLSLSDRGSPFDVTKHEVERPSGLVLFSV